jgi:hypothetical protein
MSGQPTASGQTRPTPVFEALPDLEARNPYLRWGVHLGLPMTVSIAIHVLVAGLLVLKSFEFSGRKTVDVGEYNATLNEDFDKRLEDAFTWNKPEELELEQPNEIEPVDNLLTENLSADDLDTSEITGANDGFGMDEGSLSLLGTGTGSGAAGSGGLGSTFGEGTGLRIGEAGLWGEKIRANKIVYVVDFSGSIVIAVQQLKRELKRSISDLKPFQSFEVVLFYTKQDQALADSFASSLVSANEDNVRKFLGWLDAKTPSGGSDPMPALKRALALKPDVILLFSDGLLADPEKAEKEFKSLNKANTKLYCWVFDEVLLEDTSGVKRETDGSRRLRRLAEQNGGKVNIVTGKELMR